MREVVPVVLAVLLFAPACGSNGDEARTTGAREPTDADAVIGDYERHMTRADIQRTAENRREGQQVPSPGKVRLVVRDGVMQVFVPEGFSISQELAITEDEWRIGPYFTEDAFCPGDRPTRYSWKLEGEELTLSPKDEACPDRDSTLTGTWTRIR
jgi:hypothetical protein